MSFTHLQVRSGYSLMDSTIQVNQLVKQAKALGFTKLALTDYEVMHGAISFYQACLNEGIQPIIGMIVQMNHQDKAYTCTLLAKNKKGYQNLLRLTSKIQTENDPLTLDDLNAYARDLFCLVKYKEVNDLSFTEIKSVFDENVYLTIDATDLAGENAEDLLLDKDKKNLVVANEALFLEKKDLASYGCLQAMKNNKEWEEKLIDENKRNAYLLTKAEAEQLFSQFPQALKNTEEIAKQCQVELTFHHQLLPKFPLETETSKEALKRLCHEGLRKKYHKTNDKIIARLNYELETINKLEFNDYFLIVADLVNFAKKSNIAVGPGRGSAAGSIVAYLLDITTVDPLEHDLLFERFLNPYRATMPDIDIDFSDKRRDEVIDYVKEKYGYDCVAQIVTFGRFAPRSLMRELMKVMNIDKRDQAYVLKHVTTENNQSLLEFLQENQDFANYVKQSSSLTQLFVHAITLEGLPRHASTHAAGIVLTDSHLIEHVPVMSGSDDVYLTQYAMNELEALGILKIDLLGLKNLSMIEQIIASIKQTNNIKITLSEVNQKDEKTFKLLQQGLTNGVFQLESEGMKRVLKQLKPTELSDIVALNALYRPGPMDQIPTFINRKFKKEPVIYVHEDLEPILKDTYGVLVYQEQIMQIAHKIAGFTLGEADLLRRAVSKKEAHVMADLKKQFISGCIKNGYRQAVSEEIFSWINRFANYGFNKSHSVAYSKISYDLSYLKANYPTNFFAELLSSTLNQPAKFAMYIQEAKDLGIQILPPSINDSYGKVTVEGDAIRLGLVSIKGIGYQSVQEIVKARKNGEYTDLFDFYLRTSSQIIKRNIIETLILAGAFDTIYPNRASLIASIDQAESRTELFGDILESQNFMFSKGMKLKPTYIEMDDYSLLEKLANEKELVGIYLSNHPLKEYRTSLTKEGFVSLKDLNGYKINQSVKIAAIIQEVRKIRTVRGDSMAFLTLSDETTELSAVVFPEVYRKRYTLLSEGEIVDLTVKLTERNGERQVIINQVNSLNLEASQKQLFIKVIPELEAEVHQTIQATIKDEPGEIPIILHFEKSKKTFKLNESYLNSGSDYLVDQLQMIFGEKNVVLNIKKRYHNQ